MKLFNFFNFKTKSKVKEIENNLMFHKQESLNISTDKLSYSSSTTIISVLDFIKDNSKRLGVHLNDSASDIDIDQFEQNKMFLPDDFKLLYKFSNGFETDQDIFRLIPLKEIINNKKDDYLISDSSFHFTEYMIYSDMWTVDINLKNKNDYKIYNKADDIIFLTNSIAEFLITFINRGIYDGLYQWRDDIKKQTLSNKIKY